MSRHRKIESAWKRIVAAGTVAIASAIALFAPSVSIAVPNDSFEYFSDLNLSIYAGRNIVSTLYESEGTTICDGSFTSRIRAGIAGKVEWGMGYIPSPNADYLAVGGDAAISQMGKTIIGGNVRIGGKSKGSQPTFVTTKDPTGISDTPGTFQAELGKQNALMVDLDGNGKRTDFNGFKEKAVLPLSKDLAGRKATGAVSCSTIDDVERFGTHSGGSLPISIKNEGLLIFQGDGKSDTQVFDLDLEAINAVYDENGYSGWSLDFEGIPDNAHVIVNVHTPKNGTVNSTFHTGWRTMLNGKDITVAVNDTGSKIVPFRDFASHLIWNFDNKANTMVTVSDNMPAYGYNASYLMFPGSLLTGEGSFHTRIDTNGRVIAGQDIIMSGSEHHNLPWNGSRITGEKQPTPGSATIKITATVTSDGGDVTHTKFDLHEGDDGTGTAIQTKSPDGNGTVEFDPIDISYGDLGGEKSKDYSFSVTESGETGEGSHVAKYHVTVTDDGISTKLLTTVKSENTVFKISTGTDTGNGGNADSNGNVTDTKGQQTPSNTPSVGETGKRTNGTSASGNSTLLQTGIEYIGFACAALAGIAVYMFIRSRRIK